MKMSLRTGEKGAVAVMVAILLLSLLLVAGAAIDFGRMLYARSVMQRVADSASLGAGLEDIDLDDTLTVQEERLKAAAQKLINANNNLSPKLARIQPITVSYTPPNGTTPDKLQLTIPFVVTTEFLKIMGVPEISLSVASTTQLPQGGPIDLALVLDTTASMNDFPKAGTERKIDTLKTAAKDLVYEVMRNASSERNDIKVGVVPFSTYVNVGLINPVPSWVMPIERVNSSCTYEFPNAECKPAVRYDCLVDGVMKKDACVGQDCSAKGKMTCSIGTKYYKWGGCIGARTVVPPNNPDDISKNKTTLSYIDNIADPTTIPYPGMATLSAPTGCGTTLLPLASNKKDVIDKIDALIPAGDTHIPAGLIWGWNVLAPGEPYDARTLDDLRKIGGRKSLVLFTDGINSLSPRLFDGAYAKNGDGSRLTPEWRDGSKSNQLISTICENIKKDGIEVYTVLFDVAAGSDTEARLKDCASGGKGGGNWFVATKAADLKDAFRKISDKLKTLKLVE